MSILLQHSSPAPSGQPQRQTVALQHTSLAPSGQPQVQPVALQAIPDVFVPPIIILPGKLDFRKKQNDSLLTVLTIGLGL